MDIQNVYMTYKMLIVCSEPPFAILATHLNGVVDPWRKVLACPMRAGSLNFAKYFASSTVYYSPDLWKYCITNIRCYHQNISLRTLKVYYSLISQSFFLPDPPLFDIDLEVRNHLITWCTHSGFTPCPRCPATPWGAAAILPTQRPRRSSPDTRIRPQRLGGVSIQLLSLVLTGLSGRVKSFSCF